MTGKYRVVDLRTAEILFEDNFKECRNYVDNNIEKGSELYYNVWIKPA